jgi:CRISPR type I-E-associated protein CasB/Cse2
MRSSGRHRLARAESSRQTPRGNCDYRTAGFVWPILEKIGTDETSWTFRRQVLRMLWLWPLAEHNKKPNAEDAKLEHKSKFNFGAYLRGTESRPIVSDGRYRRLVAAHTRDELDHRLREVLHLRDASVDWVQLLHDLMMLESNEDSRRKVLEEWNRGYYKQQSKTEE